MSRDYWVKHEAEGVAFGPYTGREIQQFASEGIVTQESLVSLEDGNWHRAGSIENIFPSAPIPDALPELAAAVEDGSESNAAPALTPDKRFRGVFQFLHATSLSLGILALLTALLVGGAIFGAAVPQGSEGSEIAYVFVLLVSFGPTSILLIAAGSIGLIEGRAERLLIFACVVAGSTGAVKEFLSLYLKTDVVFHGVGMWGPIVAEAGQVTLSLTFPVLCFAGIAAVRRERKSKCPPDPCSPWLPLARAVAGISIVGGLLLTAGYAKTVVEYRQYADYQPPQQPVGDPMTRVWQVRPRVGPTVGQIHQDEWVEALVGATLSLCLLVGGLIGMFTRRTGRIPIMMGAACLLGFLILRLMDQQMDQQMMTATRLATKLGDMEPLFFFLIFASIVLLREGLSKPPSGNPDGKWKGEAPEASDSL